MKDTPSLWQGEGPEPNPVVRIIAIRTAQTTALTAPVLVSLAIFLPPSGFWRVIPWIGGLVSAGLSAYFGATFHARSPLFSWLSGKNGEFLSRLPPSEGDVVAVTFDDGPHPETTPRLLDLLAEAQVTATFFLVGERVSRYPKIVRRIADEGHTIGLHGLHHRTMVLQSASEIRADLGEARRRVEQATGKALPTPLLLRPPYGFKTPILGRVAARLGCRIVAWSVDPRDYDEVTAATLVKRVAEKVAPGSIVLLHERPGAGTSVEALPRLLALFQERGLRCARIGENAARSARKVNPR
ncbi:MAG: polysaccharide deacetylase family protein [Cytophagales bacterium]|nr:polysaccharide deacetylase family protein [Armatimonadota bacterium]